ncbi:MAG: 50S ribosomal protein L4 [Ignavibacteriales bacterium]|nr:50S ribosomal protein L4 [Ignavibacteriales bacterium]
MKHDVFKIDGTKSGNQVELSDNIFGIEPNEHVMYLAVKSYLANQRQGTHKTKERNEVRGGGKKPWRQKGRGGARAGTSRSPLWVGGGRIFGPKPRDYSEKLNKKVKSLARKSALSLKTKTNNIVVLEDFNFDEIKTRQFSKIVDAFEAKDKKLLLLTNGTLEKVYKSGRNIPNVQILEANKASTYDLLNNQVLFIQQSAIELLQSTFN